MANVKISELTAATAATPDDLIVLVDDPSGTPVTKKLSVAALRAPVITEMGAGDGALPTDAAVSDIVRVIYNGNGSVQNPSNPVDGKTIRWMLTQDGTGSRIITLDTKFHLPTSHVGALPWSTAADATDLLAATYCASRDQWDVIAFVPGY